MPFMDKMSWRDWCTLLVGNAILICWVLFRFTAKSINFDLVGQQLLARQWLDGNFEGSLIGPTNYILKILCLYIPAELFGMDQKLFLVVSTVLVNMVTFVGLYIVLKNILRYFSIEPGTFFRLAMVWLAAAAGSVFWVQFTNSRNIELLAGLTLLYMGLRLYEKLSLGMVALFLALASLTYFSDPLQLFMTSAVLVAYVMFHSVIFQRDKRKESLSIAALILLGYILSKLLVFITQELTGVQFIAVSVRPQILDILTHLPAIGMETAKNGIRLLAGTNEMGAWRQVLNVTVVGIFGILSLLTLLLGKTYMKFRRYTLFVVIMIIVPVAVYVMSGQPMHPADTSRYLIVLAPASVILFSIIDIEKVSGTVRNLSVYIMLALLAVNAGALFLVTAQQRGDTFLDTSRLEQTYAYLETNGYRYGYASMDTAIPSMYFLARTKDYVLLPLSCEANGVRKATLFYDKNIFLQNETGGGDVPIILDGSAISNYPNTCSVDRLKKQLGAPHAIDYIGDNTVLLYASDRIAQLEY